MSTIFLKKFVFLWKYMYEYGRIIKTVCGHGHSPAILEQCTGYDWGKKGSHCEDF